jgi:23S rRNA pseudouridine1911/1915/1917 synthase
VRLDKYVAGYDNISRSEAQRLIEEGRVRVKGEVCRDKSRKLEADDRVDISKKSEFKDPICVAEEELAAEDILLDVVYEDDEIIIVNKDRGMLVHPSGYEKSGTLVNALIFRLGNGIRNVGEPSRPGIVHRLDRDTGGLIVAAKTCEAYEDLRRQFDLNKVQRKYMALCYNVPPEKHGIIDRPIGMDKKGTIKRKIEGRNAKEAVTEYRLIERHGSYSLIEAVLHTGRTHQIRVHMAAIGCPLVGDPLYGPTKDRFKLGGQALYSYYLGFYHPKTKEFMTFSCEMPDWFKKALNKAEQLS